MNQPRPIKICIVSVHSYPVINPDAPGLFGGMETISWDFARQMARLPDTEVSFVVTHRTAPRRSLVDGVTVVEATDRMEWYHQDLSCARRTWRTNRRIPPAELFSLLGKLATWVVTRPFRKGSHLRWQVPSHWLTEIDADIYVAFGVNIQSDWTRISAGSVGRPSALCLMSDFDIDQRFRDDPDFVNQYGVCSTLASRIISQANGIVSQTLFQQRQLKEIWQRDSILIGNPLNLQIWDEQMRCQSPIATPTEPFVLWVGRADRFHKRPLDMLQAIKANPQIRFLMVLNPADPDVATQIQNEKLINLTIISQVAAGHMASLMRAASVFATSSSVAFEGLPSVLLQAAAASTPIVSLEVAADWLEKSGAGVCVHGDYEEFAKSIARFVKDRNSPEVQRFAVSGRRYVETQHCAAQQSARLLDYLRGIVDARRMHDDKRSALGAKAPC